MCGRSGGSPQLPTGIRAEHHSRPYQIDIDGSHIETLRLTDRIVFLVSSYHGHSLEWVSRAYCRIVDAADPDQEVELARFRLSLEVRDTGVVMAAIVRTDAGWTLRTIGEGVPITVPTEGLDALKRFL